jgi:hypothetical protein
MALQEKSGFADAVRQSLNASKNHISRTVGSYYFHDFNKY